MSTPGSGAEIADKRETHRMKMASVASQISLVTKIPTLPRTSRVSDERSTPEQSKAIFFGLAFSSKFRRIRSITTQLFGFSAVHETITIALVALASATSVSAVCGLGGEIGIGFTTYPGSGEDYVIVDNNCNGIDSKTETAGVTTCGGYDGGSYVVCDHGNIPVSVQTPGGPNWGKCIPSSETCQYAQIQWCCSTA
ncbi:hypothetical protein ACEPAF_2143 [Sanghuangporus sanghuang]